MNRVFSDKEIQALNDHLRSLSDEDLENSVNELLKRYPELKDNQLVSIYKRELISRNRTKILKELGI